MYRNSNLDKYLRKMSKNCAELIDEMLDDRTYVTHTQVPVFKNGYLASTRNEKVIDYRKIRFAVTRNKQWTGNSSFNICKNILKSDVTILRGDGPHDDDPDDFAVKQLALFVAQLAKDNGHKSPTKFRTTLSKFYCHLRADLHQTTYIAPLYSVKGGFSMIRLPPNLHVREVTVNEYSRIVRLQSIHMRELDQYQRRLKFVLSCNLPGPPSKDLLQKAISDYSLALSLLKLFKDGYPQFGRVYEIESEYMDVGRIESTPSYYENPTEFKEIQMSKADVKKFEMFYHAVTKKRNEIKKPEFLFNAIARFGMAYVHRSSSNKIVDYVISLEALLTDSPGESTLKLAHRTAALYADTDSERVDTWEFMKQVYGFRSGMVHKSEERPVKIRSATIGVDDVESRLYKITKRSIHRMIGLLGPYKKQKEILDALDRSIYDRKEMGMVRKMWRLISSYYM